METIGSRVRKEREAQNITRSDFAKKTGIGYSTIAELERGGMQTTTKLRLIADALDVSLQWLETGKGPKNKGTPIATSFLSLGTQEPYIQRPYILVEQLDAVADMGGGRENLDYPEVIRSMEYTEAFIRNLIGFIPRHGRLKLVTGCGNSMAPVIQPGDVVLVDTGIQMFEGDGIYLINTGHGQQIKALQDRGDAVYVVSANPLYPAFPFPSDGLIGGKNYLKNKIERFN
ncbi:XRE family transcriptional regulator [Xylella fastidiosa]|uniref:XRE family transcriptional regulator n=1 Tax=Xylella fastidiosa TaxID=2371 RepID=UPI0007337147|nr:helix-turn-helix transcriptional regulator [Xylella fastidiosa]